MKHCITLLTLLLAPLAELHAVDASVDERVYQHQRTPTPNATFSNDDPTNAFTAICWIFHPDHGSPPAPKK